MQRDLEETNFNTINTLPITPACLSNGMSADMNANETMNNENGNAQQIIDSAA